MPYIKNWSDFEAVGPGPGTPSPPRRYHRHELILQAATQLYTQAPNEVRPVYNLGPGWILVDKSVAMKRA